MDTKELMTLEEHHKIVKQLASDHRDALEQEFGRGYRHGWNNAKGVKDESSS